MKGAGRGGSGGYFFLHVATIIVIIGSILLQCALDMIGYMFMTHFLLHCSYLNLLCSRRHVSLPCSQLRAISYIMYLTVPMQHCVAFKVPS